jgi:hypothetical protein
MAANCQSCEQRRQHAQPSAPNSSILYPIVPDVEASDARARINLMQSMIEAQRLRQPHARVDPGLLQEISTARLLREHHRFESGEQISRPLTAKEKASGHKGNCQMILVRMGPRAEQWRELDMVCIGDPSVEYSYGAPLDKTLYIVEAKDTASVDAHQLALNVQLAQYLGARVAYSFPGKKPSQRTELEKKYKDMRGPEKLGGPLVFICTQPLEGAKGGRGLDSLPTYEQTWRSGLVESGEVEFDPENDYEFDNTYG